jgi:uncharacterized membrane protein YebE (DUF533 family)
VIARRALAHRETIMSFGNIIGNMLNQGMSGQTHNRLRAGTENAERSGGIEQMLGSLMRGSGASGAGGGGLAQRARDFLGKEQAGGMSGAKIGGLGAAAGALLGGGIGGAARGGAMAVLGTLALKAWRDHQAQQGPVAPDGEPSQDEVQALTGPETERLVLRAMIGAAQVDGRVDEAEMQKILGRMHEDEVSEEERRAAREEAQRPVDVEQLGAQVSRPEVATEVYLAALMAVDIDTEAERDYFRRLAKALRLDAEVVSRLHRMTGAPSVTSAAV